MLDTSVFIGREPGRAMPRTAFPDEMVVSVVTIAELRAGVLAARDTSTRARRLATVDALSDVEMVPAGTASP
ncbi:MAG: PIN domain-containing protein [Angustibacter sp.]